MKQALIVLLAVVAISGCDPNHKSQTKNREENQKDKSIKNSARMPDSFIVEKERVVSEMAVGESGYIMAIIVHTDLRCFLVPGSVVSKGSSFLKNIKVERREDGYYAHLPLNRKFKPEDWSFSIKRLIPIKALYYED